MRNVSKGDKGAAGWTHRGGGQQPSPQLQPLMKSSLRGRYFSTLASGRQAASRGRGELSPQLRVRLPLVAALAEGDESLGRVVQGGLAALAPPALPLAFQVVHIVARRNGPGVVVRLRVQPREVGRGQGAGWDAPRLTKVTKSSSSRLTR